MSAPGGYHLFRRDELSGCVPGWTNRSSQHDSISAPGDTLQAFHTLIAVKTATEADDPGKGG
jgi:hypothetical protein